MGNLMFNLSQPAAPAQLKEEYDVVIIGAGPAGLTAAIYTSRAKLSTLVLEKEVVGGAVETTDMIENYPGFPEGVTGHDLAVKMRKQAEKFGTEIATGLIEELDLQSTPKRIRFNGQDIKATSVIIATGTRPKKLNVPGEDKFAGRGVSYCATCDAAFFQDKEIAFIGCGNSGLQEGLFTLRFAKKIYFIEFMPESKAEKILQERIQRHPQTVCHYNTQLLSINGDEHIESITVKDRATGKVWDIPVQGVFVFVGLQPNTEFLKNSVKVNKWGYIETDEHLQTSVPGVFAAGDVRNKVLYQITTAVGDGSVAAVSVEHYVDRIKSKIAEPQVQE